MRRWDGRHISTSPVWHFVEHVERSHHSPTGMSDAAVISISIYSLRPVKNQPNSGWSITNIRYKLDSLSVGFYRTKEYYDTSWMMTVGRSAGAPPQRSSRRIGHWMPLKVSAKASMNQNPQPRSVEILSAPVAFATVLKAAPSTVVATSYASLAPYTSTVANHSHRQEAPRRERDCERGKC